MTQTDPIKLPLKGTLSKFIKLKIVEIQLGNCPAHFFITAPSDVPADAPDWWRGWQLAAGRGLTRDSAALAAQAEAYERMSIWSRGPTDPLRIDESLGTRQRLPANAFLKFSTLQLLQLKADLPQDHFLTTSSALVPVDNFSVEMLHLNTGEPVAIPALVAIFADEFRYLPNRQLSTSSGSALWETFEGALERAVLELVERDAVAGWWYNRLPAPVFASDLVTELLDHQLADWLTRRRRQTRILQVPTDLPVTVAAAISNEPDGNAPSIGFSASFDPAGAASGAVLEMLQGEISLHHMRQAQAQPTPPPVPALLAWSNATRVPDTPYLAGFGRVADAPAPSDAATLRAALAAGGIDVYYADLTRPEIGWPVARAVSPHLRDWTPRFAPGRLYDVPVALGLRDRPLTEDAFNAPFML